jgi:hypothetical protein
LDSPDKLFAGVTCVAPPATGPLAPGCYTSIPGTVLTLQPGNFKVTGKVSIASTLSGTGGVLLYLTNTASIEGNTGALTLTASNSGDYAGIAVYGDPGSFIDFKNALDLTITGAVVMQGTDADFKNHLRIVDTGCDVFVFNSFTEKNGNGATVNADQCAGLFSNASYLGVALAE